ncbi:hypothetical protein [Nocardia sp. NPDC051570]|uniref:hypothetical protein n=1 Tax=Nocardia sp. NPDC051570 TaxID=3364324 RepID=UPI00379C2D84
MPHQSGIAPDVGDKVSHQENSVIENTGSKQESRKVGNPVVWPDPSPLQSWWDAVMRGDGGFTQWAPPATA